jgi:hypothetical protein
LQNEIRLLKDELQDASRNPPNQTPANTGLESVQDIGELAVRQERAETGLEEADLLLSKLAAAPARVEAYLRQQGIALKDEAGNEDFSTERMADFLANAKADFRRTLRNIPKREAWLKQYAQAHEQVGKLMPWVNDPGDERYAQLQQMARQFPQLKTQPNWEYWLGCAIHGNLQIQRELQKRNGGNNGNGAAPGNNAGGAQPAAIRRPAALPLNTSGGGAARRVRPDKAKVDAARTAAMKTGTKASLAEYFEKADLIR